MRIGLAKGNIRFEDVLYFIASLIRDGRSPWDNSAMHPCTLLHVPAAGDAARIPVIRGRILGAGGAGAVLPDQDGDRNRKKVERQKVITEFAPSAKQTYATLRVSHNIRYGIKSSYISSALRGFSEALPAFSSAWWRVMIPVMN